MGKHETGDIVRLDDLPAAAHRQVLIFCRGVPFSASSIPACLGCRGSKTHGLIKARGFPDFKRTA
jgi:hypothetical protein